VTSLQSQVRAFSVTADILGAAAILTLGTTLFFTLRTPSRAAGAKAQSPHVAVGASPVGAFLRIDL
jgi:hypothetical protein